LIFPVRPYTSKKKSVF